MDSSHLQDFNVNRAAQGSSEGIDGHGVDASVQSHTSEYKRITPGNRYHQCIYVGFQVFNDSGRPCRERHPPPSLDGAPGRLTFFPGKIVAAEWPVFPGATRPIITEGRQRVSYFFTVGDQLALLADGPEEVLPRVDTLWQTD
jgi:hypothetical protein